MEFLDLNEPHQTNQMKKTPKELSHALIGDPPNVTDGQAAQEGELPHSKFHVLHIGKQCEGGIVEGGVLR